MMQATSNWLQTESSHYVFHYKEGSFAHGNIADIIKIQEQRYREITDYFMVSSEKKADYYLCDSREELGQLAEDVPGNALFWYDDDEVENVRIYVVYNEEMQCNGYHEETHAITHLVNEPSSSAIAEGIAVLMEKTWAGVAIDLCTYIYLQEGKYISVERLICDNPGKDDDLFYQIDCAISYPIMGSFVSFLLFHTKQGKEGFMKLYRYKGDNWREEFQKIYQCSLGELEKGFIKFISGLEYSEESIAYGKAQL